MWFRETYIEIIVEVFFGELPGSEKMVEVELGEGPKT